MILFFSIIILVYGVFMVLLIYGFDQTESFQTKNEAPKISFSIIVPFRNEAKNLPLLLESFSKLNYPKQLFEVLLVDDSSTDSFLLEKYDFAASVLNSIKFSNSPKKDAISTALLHAKNLWIVTTDADCVVQTEWLFTLSNFIQKSDLEMVAGTVNYKTRSGFLAHFQEIEMATLQGVTIGSFGIRQQFMCNGANFAYKKSFFEELNGFEGNNNLASGDDVFLLQKALKFSKKVGYLKNKNHIVVTNSEKSWSDLFQQRVRWASKSTGYESAFGKILSLVVLLGNLSLVLGLVLVVLGTIYFINFIILFFIKIFVDFCLLYKSNRFLNTNVYKYLILSFLLYPFFSTIVGLYSIFGKFSWKGRSFNAL